MFALLRIITVLIAVPLILLTQLLIHVVPALFQIFVWLTLPLFTLVTQLTRWQPTRGALIMLATLGWAGAALGLLPWLDVLLPLQVAWITLLTIGGLWGLCVGYQAALRWEADHLRLPNTDPRQFGLPGHFFGGTDTGKRKSERLDELLRDGIILGERDD